MQAYAFSIEPGMRAGRPTTAARWWCSRCGAHNDITLVSGHPPNPQALAKKMVERGWDAHPHERRRVICAHCRTKRTPTDVNEALRHYEARVLTTRPVPFDHTARVAAEALFAKPLVEVQTTARAYVKTIDTSSEPDVSPTGACGGPATSGEAGGARCRKELVYVVHGNARAVDINASLKALGVKKWELWAGTPKRGTPEYTLKRAIGMRHAW